LFSGNQTPPGEFVLKMRTTLSELADSLGGAQQAADRTALAAGNKTLAEAVSTVRNTPRLGLANAWLQRHRDALIGAVDGLSLWMLPLSQSKPVLFSKTGTNAPPISDRETDLTGVLLKNLEEENPFPLAGIVVFSDGRNLGGTLPDAVTQAATLRSVPIYAAGVGGAKEPTDIAVREVYFPPFAVVGKPVGVRANLKTILPKPEKVELELLRAGGDPVTNQTLEIAGQQAMQRWLLFTPEKEGLQRLTVRVGAVEGEVAPPANNSMDLTVRVRTEPVRVLFLDWKPRWQSRFVNNILSRLGYLDVNSIIVLAHPGGLLKRGIGKGFWPEDAGSLALYDLVILGDLPPEMLTQVEWKQLADYVEAGGSLALLGTGRRDPLPPVVQALLPTLPRAADTAPPADTATLQLTLAGRYHPVTRSLVDVVESAKVLTTERQRNDTLELLQTSDGRPLISARFCGKGKILYMDTDRLWRRLNARALDAHTALVAGITDWAVEGGTPAARLPRPDLYRYTSRESVQIWTAADSGTNPVVELRDGERMLEAQAVPVCTGATWAAAVFETVPAGDWTVTRRGGGSAPEPLRVVNRSRELLDFARDEVFLRTLAAHSGGAYATFTDAGRLLNDVHSRSRVEHHERVWRLWDSGWILGLLVLLLTGEWVWRKLAGLV
jgi:hypothetical protein